MIDDPSSPWGYDAAGRRQMSEDRRQKTEGRYREKNSTRKDTEKHGVFNLPDIAR
jgi:hypothetical protein